eukprot:scaffold7476_cov20-Tisochrysis_lutea.AAC.3
MRNSDEGAMMGTEENVKGQHASSVGTAACDPVGRPFFFIYECPLLKCSMETTTEIVCKIYK